MRTAHDFCESNHSRWFGRLPIPMDNYLLIVVGLDCNIARALCSHTKWKCSGARPLRFSVSFSFQVHWQGECSTHTIYAYAQQTLYTFCLPMIALLANSIHPMEQECVNARERREQEKKNSSAEKCIQQSSVTKLSEHIIAVRHIIFRKLSRQIGRSAMQLNASVYSIDGCFRLCTNITVIIAVAQTAGRRWRYSVVCLIDWKLFAVHSI